MSRRACRSGQLEFEVIWQYKVHYGSVRRSNRCVRMAERSKAPDSSVKTFRFQRMKEFWSSIEGVGSNPTSDNNILIWVTWSARINLYLWLEIKYYVSLPCRLLWIAPQVLGTVSYVPSSLKTATRGAPVVWGSPHQLFSKAYVQPWISSIELFCIDSITLPKWSDRGLNSGLLACKASTLPLSYHPFTIILRYIP